MIASSATKAHSVGDVHDADLNVAAGEVVCLLGPSGCGKTTTLRMIAGLERATGGDVIIAGRRMNELAPEKRDIAMVFQFYALYPALTVGQNIAMPLHYESEFFRIDALDHAVEQIHLRIRIGHVAHEGERERSEKLKFRRPCAAA